MRPPHLDKYSRFKSETTDKVPECRQAQVLQVFTLNRKHEVENKEKEVPDQVKCNAQKTEAFSHSLILRYKFNLVKHDEERYHDEHSSQERVVSDVLHVGI